MPKPAAPPMKPPFPNTGGPIPERMPTMGLPQECIYLFQRFTLQSNEHKMHKDYLGKLASQNNFMHSLFAVPEARPFEPLNTFLRQPHFCYKLSHKFKSFTALSFQNIFTLIYHISVISMFNMGKSKKGVDISHFVRYNKLIKRNTTTLTNRRYRPLEIT